MLFICKTKVLSLCYEKHNFTANRSCNILTYIKNQLNCAIHSIDSREPS